MILHNVLGNLHLTFIDCFAPKSASSFHTFKYLFLLSLAGWLASCLSICLSFYFIPLSIPLLCLTITYGSGSGFDHKF